MSRPSLRASGLLSGGVLLAAAFLSRREVAAGESLTPFADLTDSDPITAIVSRTATIDGRLVRYPTPTRDLAAALEARAAGGARGGGGDGAVPSRDALRHLAEARRELGDLPGAEEALSRWAASSPSGGGTEWNEVARWAARYRRWPLARTAAAKALDAPASKGGFPLESRKGLATDRIEWAGEDRAAGDPDQLRGDRASRFPDDPKFAEEWIRALEKAKKLREADDALLGARALAPERRALLAAQLRDARGDLPGALDVLEKAVLAGPGQAPSPELLKVFAAAVDRTGPRRRDVWRASLDRRFDPAALSLYHAYFQGKGRGDLSAELLLQTELRHSGALDRIAWLQLSRLHEASDTIPEAFRSRLAAAQGASADAQKEDLAVLVHLALRAGARPLAWGTYNDEPLRWAARIDVHPGFTSGALSFLMTGFDGRNALHGLEAKRLPERTFRTARLLLDELERRAPAHPSIPALVVEVMERYVQQGHGADALQLLPKADRGEAPVRAAARRAALLALRQTKEALPREAALWKERLRLLAPDGSVPPMAENADADGYAAVLREAIARLDARDRSHRTSLDLLLAELDRLPDAEALWLFGTGRVEEWKLDDEMEGRYRAALKSFEGPEWWKSLARWYARREKRAELKALADDVASSFRGSELFRRDPGVSALVRVEGQPELFIRVADYLRLRALERFPASPAVLKEAESHLVSLSTYRGLTGAALVERKERGVVDDRLLENRRDAVLFQDDDRRARLISGLMRDGALERFLVTLEQKSGKTPVDHLFLLDGWSRLSRFEQAVPWADRLAESYPGDLRRATDAVTLHRSLSGLFPAEAENAARIARTALPALESPEGLLTQVGEMWQDLDRPELAGAAFRQVLGTRPRNSATILEVASTFWDYGRFEEASGVIAEGRRTLGLPHLHAFEAGVLKEETKDLPGALQEYLSSVGGEDAVPAAEAEERCGTGDARASRRLARLAGHQGPRALLLARIDALRPGSPESEAAAVRLLAVVAEGEEPVDPWDDWVDDMPHDPVGREQRTARKEASRPAVEKGVVALGSRLQEKSFALADRATDLAFIAALRRWRRTLLDPRWTAPPEQAGVELESRLLARASDLAPTPEARIDAELARARYLAANGRAAEAARIPPALLSRIDALPEGPAKIRALVTLARFAEERGDPVEAWSRVSAKYPWSLGVLDDHLEFLFRTGKAREALDLLEKRSASAAPGHRERLVDRLVSESLDRGDVVRAKRALQARLSLPLEPEDRVVAAGQLARISLREEPAFDAVTLGKREAKLVPDRLQADLWNALALAARKEARPRADLTLSIEALNRRLDRDWLAGAAKAAAAAGLDPELLRFFEAQRARSPRDVRWAVAVRDLKMFAADLPGAIEAAREACAIAPEQESLQREAVTLFERAGRFRDASDFLAGWAKPRAGDESVAMWRAGLLVRAGDNTRAVEMVRAYLAAAPAAGKAPAADDEEGGGGGNLARAVSRFLQWNRPRAAWMLASPPDGKTPARDGRLPHRLRAELALRAGRFELVFEKFGRNDDFLREAAPALERTARPEQLAALQETLLARLFPTGKAPDTEALNRYWSFARSAGLHRFDEAIARKLFERGGPGPWGTAPPFEFVKETKAVDTAVDSRHSLVFAPLPTEREWVGFLVQRDRTDLLSPVLDRMVAEIDRQVSSGGAAAEVPFARWFPVEPFSRMAASGDHEAWRQAVRRWFRSAETWARFLQATGKQWDVTRMVRLLDGPARDAWIQANAASAGKKPGSADVVRRVGASLAALVENAPGASRDPDIVRLRGPRTIGDVLGNDPKWAFSELSSGGGRPPQELWDHRPGDAWYVLETLARLREKDSLSPFVPLDSVARGQEGARGFLASRTAEAIGEIPLALQLDGGDEPIARLDRLERRLRLLASSPERRSDAAALFAKEVAGRQRTVDAAAFRQLERIGSDLALGAAIDRIDAAKPVSNTLLVSLVDRYGPSRVSTLVPVDASDFRATMGWRWRSDLDGLSGERLTWAIDRLWAEGALSFPAAATVRARLFWPEAAAWLSLLDPPRRKQGLTAVRSLPDPAGLLVFAASLPPETSAAGEALQLLLLRAEVTNGNSVAALKRLEMLAAGNRAFSRVPALPSPVAPPANPESSGDDGEPAQPRAAERQEPSSTLRAALRIVRLSKDPKDAVPAEEFLAEKLRKGEIPGSLSQQRFLAVDLATKKDDLDRVLQQLERDWAGGDWDDNASRLALADLLAGRDEVAAWRWFGRVEEARNLENVRSRSSLLVKLKKAELARGEWIESLRLPLDRPEELIAFDAWRQLPAGLPEPPASWKASVVFWRKKAPDFPAWSGELAAHLKRSPYDRLAARSVLRSLAPASEEAVAPAVAALGSPQDVSSWRVVRDTANRSLRGAAAFLPPGKAVTVADLRNRRFSKAEIDGLLRTLARVGASGERTAYLVDQSVASLEDLGVSPVAPLRSEVARIRLSLLPPPAVVQSTASRWSYLRPADLTWDLYSRILTGEESR